jgi:hypothetical protein
VVVWRFKSSHALNSLSTFQIDDVSLQGPLPAARHTTHDKHRPMVTAQTSRRTRHRVPVGSMSKMVVVVPVPPVFAAQTNKGFKGSFYHSAPTWPSTDVLVAVFSLFQNPWTLAETVWTYMCLVIITQHVYAHNSLHSPSLLVSISPQSPPFYLHILITRSQLRNSLTSSRQGRQT